MKSIPFNRKPLLNGIFISLLLAGVFAYLSAVIEPMLHFHMQQNPYFADGHFFQQHAQRVGGLGTYLSNYLMQAFYSNMRGSLTITLLISIMPLSLTVLFKRLKVYVPVVLFYVPVILATALFHDYYFPLTILLQAVLLYLAVLIYGYLLKFRFVNWLSGLGLYALLYYVFGSGTAFIFGLSGIVLNCYQSGTKQLIIRSLLIVLLLVLLPFLAYRFLFNLSPTQAFFYFVPELPVTLTYHKTVWMYLLIASMPLILLTGLISSKLAIPEKIKNITRNNTVQLAASLSMLLLSFWLINLPADQHAKNIAQVDYDTYHQNWDQAINLSLADQEYDFLTNLNYNRAIDHAGLFLEMFFDYPQLLGIKSLNPDNLGTAFYSIQASEYYFDLNYITRSQHLAYAALVLEPYNARVIKQLVKTNLILGNIRAAKTYLHLLSLNPLFDDFVNKYQAYTLNINKIEEEPLLSKKRKYNPDNFAIPLHITNRLEDLIVKDSSNQTAWEHLQLCFLLEHQLDNFIGNFETSMNFYSQIPEVYEQALLVYIYSTRSRTELLRSISNESKEKFTTFLQILKDKNNNLQAAQADLTDFENTYIYYMKYLSPMVTNLEVITTK
ncbi:MAG: hypothetical protein JXR22_02570 [Prolixibacteraceae bacterium]|nr:hypothetical protein [Prolixibacteraceae bacterium]